VLCWICCALLYICDGIAVVYVGLCHCSTVYLCRWGTPRATPSQNLSCESPQGHGSHKIQLKSSFNKILGFWAQLARVWPLRCYGAYSAVQNHIAWIREQLTVGRGIKGKKKQRGEKECRNWNDWTLIMCINANIRVHACVCCWSDLLSFCHYLSMIIHLMVYYHVCRLVSKSIVLLLLAVSAGYFLAHIACAQCIEVGYCYWYLLVTTWALHLQK